MVSQAHKYLAKKLSAVARNSDKCLTFSFDQYRFKDSLMFMNASLEKLVKLNKYNEKRMKLVRSIMCYKPTGKPTSVTRDAC